MNKNRKNAVIIIFVINAIVLSFLDTFIPIPIPVPGVKLGLGNIITIIGIAFLGLKDVLFIVITRCFVVAVLTRGITMLPFSLSGGILSALLMWLLYRKFSQYFSIKMISIVGAISHSTAQIIVASVMLGQLIVFYYLPVILVISIFAGIITGSISEIAIREMENKELFEPAKEIN